MKLFKRAKRAGSVALLTVLVGPWTVSAQNSGDTLERGFQNPPESAKPRVWWHWMNGNITKEGIKLDLEWMKRVGIGGFQNFDAALNTPQVVEKRLVYMTPEWKDAFKYTVTLADQLGLEMAIAGSPGWSESGGPWVPPAQAMKKFVWSETRVQGGQPFRAAPRARGARGARRAFPAKRASGRSPARPPVSRPSTKRLRDKRSGSAHARTSPASRTPSPGLRLPNRARQLRAVAPPRPGPSRAPRSTARLRASAGRKQTRETGKAP